MSRKSSHHCEPAIFYLLRITSVRDDRPAHLETVGVEVRYAGTVASAIEQLASLPTLIVLDLMLPDGNGLEVLATVRRMNLQCKVAVVSAANDAALFHQVRLHRPDAIFGKPIDIDDFLQWFVEETSTVKGAAKDSPKQVSNSN